MLRTILTSICASVLFAGLALAEAPDWPFNYSTHYLGKFNIQGRTDNWTYDLFPDFYQVDSNTNVLEWLGNYQAGEVDIPRGTTHTGGDRVYRAETKGPLYGWHTNVTKPEIVYRGYYGDTGKLETDDHLVGNPSTIKVNGKYYRFIETYANWMTKINRFYSEGKKDTWTTSGRFYNISTDKLPDQTPDYVVKREASNTLGFAPVYKRANTRPIYSIELTNSIGQVNRFLSTVTSSYISSLYPTGWKILNGGKPVFYLYTTPAPGLKPLYLYYNTDNNDTYVTASPSGGNVPNKLPDGFHATGWGGLLGYAVKDIQGTDKFAYGCNQNSVRMQMSLDGKNWTDFKGHAPDGAVVVPYDTTSCVFPHSGVTGNTTDASLLQFKYDIFRRYGSGFPQALVRDNHIELYFTDDTPEWDGKPEGDYMPIMRRKRIKVSDVENAQAWKNAKRENIPLINIYTGQVFYGVEWGPYFASIKWSEYLKRYVDFTVNHVTGKPSLSFTHKNVAKGALPMLVPSFRIDIEDFPAESYIVGVGTGAILGSLQGTTLDLPGSSVPHIALHIVFTASERKWGPSYFKQDFHHALVLIYL